MGRFETEFLTQEDNLKGLARINTQWVERAMAHTLHRRVILDMDSSESPVHGQQEGAAYNGHFECVCYHPLFLFNQFGDCEAAKLRSGNVHSADDWQEVLDPVVERYLTAAVRLLFRADAAFAKPEIYDYLEARNIGYAIRLRSNQVLQREIAPRLIRPTEWLSPKPIVSYHDFASIIASVTFLERSRRLELAALANRAGDPVRCLLRMPGPISTVFQPTNLTHRWRVPQNLRFVVSAR